MDSSVMIRSLPTDKITLFDIKFNDRAPENSVSPWTRIVIYALRAKNIPHHVELVEIVDIPAVSQSLGIEPTQTVEPLYTLPAIYDPRTNLSLADSMSITQYLDRTYPDTLVLAPEISKNITSDVMSAFAPIEMGAFRLIVPNMLPLLEGMKSLAHFRETRTRAFGGRDLETLAPKGDAAAKLWDEIKASFDTVDSFYGGREFIMGGNQPTYPDLMIGGRLRWYRVVFGPESQEWQRIASYNDGRWHKLIAYFDGERHSK